MSEIKRIGVLTGGGDCSGLNAVVRAVTLTAINKYGCEVIGFKKGSYYSFNSKNFFPDILYGQNKESVNSFFYGNTFKEDLYGEYFLEIKRRGFLPSLTHYSHF